MKLESIYLHSFDITFDVQFFLCDNIDCEMAHFILEQSDSDEPISYTIDVNVLSWECEVSEENDAPSELVDEFLSSLDRVDIIQRIEMERQGRRNILEYTISREDVLNGGLVAYSSATSNGQSFYDGGGYYSFDVTYRDQDFMVEDLYCPNPKCNCNEVLFLFYAGNIKGVLVPEFRVQSSFSGGINGISNLSHNYTNKQIRAIFKSASVQQKIIDKWLLRYRYEEIKEVGKRSLLSARVKPINNTHTTKIGRNEPCPCGSGKKYKKCCMNK